MGGGSDVGGARWVGFRVGGRVVVMEIGGGGGGGDGKRRWW